MTRVEAIAKLKSLRVDQSDVEANHSLADEILCALLEGIGYGDVVVEWRKIKKWYD